jgi:hypothetical protein
MILAPRLFSRLSSADTRHCFAEFSTAILTALDEQEKATKLREANAAMGESQGDKIQEDVKFQPYVKVTTVKFLAQLLRDAEFVPETFVVEVLSTLMQKASHIDIRSAIVESLLSMLRSSQWDLANSILKSLEDVIPLVGTLNERGPFTDSDWEAAQKSPDGPTPPALPDCSRENTPMLTHLLSFPGTYKQQFIYKQEYVDRIVLPVLTHMQQEMKRWLQLCLASLSAPPTLIDLLPVPPRNLQVWNKALWNCLPYLPVSILEEQTQYITFCINPHPAIAEINNTLRGNALVRQKPYLSTWLNLYASGVSVESHDMWDEISELLKDIIPRSGNITEGALHESFLKIFKVAVWNASPHHRHVRYLMDKMWRMAGKDSCDRVIQAAIDCIDDLRTPNWYRDEDRKPKVLPDTFPLRLSLLPYQFRGSKTSTQEEKCRSFAFEVCRLVEEISESLYHKKLELIKKSLRLLTNVSDRILVALYVGDVTGRLEPYYWTNLPVLLRVELADVLLEDLKLSNVKEELRPRVEALVEGWKKSHDEEARRIGYTWGHAEARNNFGMAPFAPPPSGPPPSGWPLSWFYHY